VVIVYISRDREDEMVQRSTWYAKGDVELVQRAITMARATGSVGATESELDGNGAVLKSATVAREGYHDASMVRYCVQ
jgi:hypothetical protein